MDFVTAIGFLAAALTTISFVPQAVKTWKSRSTKDMSLAMYSAFTLGVFLWLIYGIYLKSLPMIIANAITFALSFIILLLKLKHG